MAPSRVLRPRSTACRLLAAPGLIPAARSRRRPGPVRTGSGGSAAAPAWPARASWPLPGLSSLLTALVAVFLAAAFLAPVPAEARQSRSRAAAAAARAKADKPARNATAPDWTLILYAATDEEDLARNYDERVERILGQTLPGNVELVAERDTFRPDGLTRLVRRGDAPAARESKPETDSASREHFAEFLDWASRQATGKKKILLVTTHSWGWRGVIQDYTVPGQPGNNTMMPLRRFAEVVEKSPLKPDLLWLDACVLSTAECIEDLKRTAPLLVLSQREMPYSGFPFLELLSILSKTPSPREFARILPGRYIDDYGHNGIMTTEEGEYFITCLASIDTAKWDAFVQEFAALVRLLDRAGLRRKLAENPGFALALADPADRNADLAEFLARVPALVQDPRVDKAAKKLLARLGYPAEVSALTAESVRLEPSDDHRSFELRIDSDGLIQGNKTLEAVKGRWAEANQDLALPADLSCRLVDIPSPSGRDREFVVAGNLTAPLRFRPWLAGTQYFTLALTGGDGRTRRTTRSRDQDFFVADRFPPGSPLVAEAHTQGAPFLHGLGIVLYPDMDETMERAVDPETGLKGPAFYRSTAFSRSTGWGEVMLLAPAGKP